MPCARALILLPPSIININQSNSSTFTYTFSTSQTLIDERHLPTTYSWRYGLHYDLDDFFISVSLIFSKLCCSSVWAWLGLVRNAERGREDKGQRNLKEVVQMLDDEGGYRTSDMGMVDVRAWFPEKKEDE